LICLAAGFLVSLALVGNVVANLFARPDGVLDVLSAVGLLVMSTTPMLALVLIGPVLLGTYPSGRFSRTGKRVAVVAGLLIAPLLVLTLIASPVIQAEGMVGPNPLWVPGLPPAIAEQAGAFAFLAYLAAVGLASVSLALRYRRSDPVERLQIRWVAANGLAILLAVLVLIINPFGLGDSAWSVWLLVTAFVPFSVAVAILRYHLYDIDRVISNAIGYGLVSIVLFAVFAAVNLALVSSVSPFVNNEAIAVAASTLLVAALFNPVRVRVQRGVDRRFHRARYDAERMVADFGTRLRDEVEIDRLHRDILDVVSRSVEPTEVHLWLRPGTAR
jgi:hypothetical protein